MTWWELKEKNKQTKTKGWHLRDIRTLNKKEICQSGNDRSTLKHRLRTKRDALARLKGNADGLTQEAKNVFLPMNLHAFIGCAETKPLFLRILTKLHNMNVLITHLGCLWVTWTLFRVQSSLSRKLLCFCSYRVILSWACEKICQPDAYRKHHEGTRVAEGNNQSKSSL